jgi:PAS domain S-box-containing protein
MSATSTPPASPDDTNRVAELEAELARMRHDLTRRVKARTAALTKSGEQLYTELLARRAAETALRVTEEKYRGFFDHAVEGTYQSTPEGRYLGVNPALARLYGHDSPAAMLAVVGDIAHDIYVDPTMRQRFQELIERDGEVRNLEYQVRRRDGTPIWISESARVARGRRGQPIYYEGTIRDITRRKEAEAEAARLGAQLLQAQKMEAIGTLAGGVAHDFNNILGAIIGYTELAQEDVPAGSAAATNLAEVLKAAFRAREHVRQILTFARQTGPERRPVRVAPIVREALSLLRATLPSTIRIERELTAKEDHAIADAAQLHQVLVNLCANAGHAMRAHGGTLHVRLANETLAPGARPAGRSLPPGLYLRLTVSDTGHGIPAEVLPRVFEPFFTTKPVGEGTGLGLSVVHGIVQGHGGAINVESTPGAGTTFTVWLPAAGPAEKRESAHPWKLNGSGQRVLLVDDEEMLAALFKEWLRRLGYQASVHTSSLAALAEFQAAPGNFDLVLTDYTMPGLTGLEFARAVRLARPDIPVLLCTGYSEDFNRAQAEAAGITGFLNKPTGLAQFSQAVGAALKSKPKEAG